MSRGTRIVSTMQKIAQPKNEDLTDIVSGDVISVDPLKIKVSDNLILTDAFLIKGVMVQRTVINIPALLPEDENYREDKMHSHTIQELQTSVDSGHSHTIPAHQSQPELGEICLWRDLIIGDKVLMIRCFSGQKYYIIQRMEGII